jgi:hypothetical protein
MQVFLNRHGEVTGPFSSDELRDMVERKEIGTDCHYWFEGMSTWETFQPKRDLDQISAIKRDSFFPFEANGLPPPPWLRRSPWRAVSAVLAGLVGFGIFLLAWQKHATEAQVEVVEALTVKDDAERYRRAISQGSAFTLEEWPAAAAAVGITSMEGSRRLLGAPNLMIDEGYRWIYFDRLIHPVTGLQTDMAVLFDDDKKVIGFESYP